MRVTFLLPGAGTRPSGGFKVAYEYANGLAARGHAVTVVHPADLPPPAADRDTGCLKRALAYGIKAVLRRWRPDTWFRMDPRVSMRWVPALAPQFVPDGDAVVATWWQTAQLLAAWPECKGEKYYLLQHLETWGGPPQRVLATWRLPLEKIVIARWLGDIARGLGEASHYIPNGLDFAAFGIDLPPGQRLPASLAMLYHGYDWKGSRDGLAAMRIARESVPELHAELFGTSPAPRDLPAWAAYHRNPRQEDLRAIYNRAAVFVAPSWTEGWPLPPAEALACGCALACTDIGGHREYAFDGHTALLSAPRDPAALARNVVRLTTDGGLRSRLSAQGHEFVRQFGWERAIAKLEAVLEGRAAAEHDGVRLHRPQQA